MANVRNRSFWSFLVTIAVATQTQVAVAQSPLAASPPKHLAYRSNQPPGAIGAMQIARGVAPAGYVQPVQISVPSGATVEVAGEEGVFSGQSDQLSVGLVVGQPYRFKVTNIPRHFGEAIYPSIELIGRLHPPEGEKNRFPVPVDFAQDDLELAIEGNMIVRVVYLENPQRAFPEAEGEQQRSEDVLANEDPLQIADQLGRPMAIIRIGSRVPMDTNGDTAFRFDSPYVEWLTPPTQRVAPGLPDRLAPIVDADKPTPRGAIPAPPVDADASDPFAEPSAPDASDELDADAVAEPLVPPSADDVEPPAELDDLDDFDADLTDPDLPIDDPFLDETFSD